MTSSNQELFLSFEKLYWQLTRGMGYQWKLIFEGRFPGSQSHILLLLDRNGRMRMTELAESLHLTPGAMTSASYKLIENGFISRINDEKDRRVVYLEMTTKGKEALSELQHEGRKIMKDVFSHLSDSDLAFLVYKFEQASLNIKHIGKEQNQ